MQEPLEPDWKLFDTAPFSFFGLSASAGRADLRRCYAALIRQFRPESHSAEFQKIRQAYELADRALSAQRSEFSEAEAVAACVSTSTSVVSVFHQTHASFEPASTETTEPQQSTVLRAKILATAQRMASDDFYAVVHGTLLEFLLAASPDTFLQCYGEFAPFVNHDDVLRQPIHRVQFTVCFLQYATWNLPEAWIEEQINFLEQNADLLHDGGEYEFLLRLLDYQRFCRQNDHDDAEAVLRPLHSIILEFYKRPWREGCRYFQGAVNLMQADQSLVTENLQYSHRRFLRMQLEFWELLASRVAADPHCGTEGPVGVVHFVASAQWKSFVATSRRKLASHPKFRRMRREVYLKKGARCLLLMAFGAFLGTMGLFLVQAFLMLIGAMVHSYEGLSNGLLNHFSDAFLICSAVGGVWWMLRVEVSRAYGDTDSEFQCLSIKEMQELYCQCIRHDLLQLLQKLAVTPREFVDYFRSPAVAVDREWELDSGFVLALLQVAVADPGMWWLQTTMPFHKPSRPY